jgi:hypothetical protein
MLESVSHLLPELSLILVSGLGGLSVQSPGAVTKMVHCGAKWHGTNPALLSCKHTNRVD